MKNRCESPRGLVVSGTHSSVGKSSISAGLMRLLTRKGFLVKPFKVGPDYIDPGHHARACGQPSYNLDSWMCPREYVKRLYADIAGAGDIAVVEGVMGLFDGAYSKRPDGSTAEIAKLLGLPVILAIDGSAMARSSAALVDGFSRFDDGLNIFGVIANRVSGPGHAKILKDAIEHYTPAKFLGHLPPDQRLEIPSRHLGLLTGREQTDALYERWADHIARHIDVDAILKSLAPQRRAPSRNESREMDRWDLKAPGYHFRVAVARDAAFQFIYQDTLDLIERLGGQIEWFSPIKDRRLPPNADLLYLPGGYPELHGRTLSANKSMLAGIREYVESGKAAVAECGGLMYLGKSIVDEAGRSRPMAGIFDFSTTLKNKRMTLGYRKLSFNPSSIARKKILLRGHEFHFSVFQDNRETPIMTQNADGKIPAVKDGYRHRNCFALYSHIYWGSSPDWLQFVLRQTPGTSPENRTPHRRQFKG